MKLAIIGNGAWGLTQSWLYSNNFSEIIVYGRNREKIEILNKSRKCLIPQEICFPKNVYFTDSIKIAIKDAEYIILCVSSVAIREVLKKMLPYINKKNQIIINTSKGIETPTLLTISDIIKEEIGNDVKFAVLSGPTLATEILKGKPTAACVASEKKEIALSVQKVLNVSSKFRLYTNEDVIGVELGGSLKNVIAIACGFSDTLGLGKNAKGALITRGIAEMSRVAKYYKAKTQTIYGLSGLGDLIATSTSDESRNYKVGMLLAQNKKIDEILKMIGQTAEGVKTSRAIYDLSKKIKIETPISKAVYNAIYTNIDTKDVLESLMNRDLKEE